ncbi:MAG: class I SAM-dependent methyltransferase [Alphaproteobacteria bacterium]
MRGRGYVTDVPYVRKFVREQAPAWLDHVALISGVAPPARGEGFAWCDLGCGQGVTAAILAASHPRGRFYGIDAMPDHIAHARRFAADAAIANVSFRAVDFAAAARLELPHFDYIVAHGVYSWVDERSREALRRFVDRHLKPGGLVYVSYNALPGRAADLPFQRLLRTLGETFSGDSVARVTAAARVVDSLHALRAPALVASPMAVERQKNKDRFPAAYLAHEVMGAHWEPLTVTEMRSAMATIGLVPVGSATLMDNYDSFVLGKAARALLAGIADENARALARDFLVDQFFRRDVYVRAGRRLGESARRRRLLAGSYALARPAARINYAISTPAGRLNFDNGPTRGIVQALAAGPRRLADIAAGRIADADLLASALVLAAAGAVLPVEPGGQPVAALERAILRRLGGPEEILYLPLPCGTALAVPRELLRRRRDGKAIAGRELAGWRRFLAAHGV